jgi:hypothetical protein
MSKFFTAWAAAAAMTVLVAPGPAGAAEHHAAGIADGMKTSSSIEVSSARRHRARTHHAYRHYHARRGYYGRPYYGPRYYSGGPYYAAAPYQPYYYRPGPGLYVGPFGFGIGW